MLNASLHSTRHTHIHTPACLLALACPQATEVPAPPPPEVQPLVPAMSEAPMHEPTPAAAAALVASAAAGCPAVPQAAAATAEKEADKGFCIPYAELFND